LLRHPALDLYRVQDVGLEGADDPSMPGVFVVPDRMAVRQAIEELLLVETCSEQAEWAGLVVYLPL
jgi:hypothetical protein